MPANTVSPQSRKRQRGHALLETGFIILPLLMTFIGIFDVAQMLFIHQTITERVRAAARYGAVNYSDLTKVRNMVLYNSPTGSGSGFMGITSSNVNVSRTGDGTNDDRINITVSGMQYTMFTPLIAGRKNMRTISASIPVESPQ